MVLPTMGEDFRNLYRWVRPVNHLHVSNPTQPYTSVPPTQSFTLICGAICRDNP